MFVFKEEKALQNRTGEATTAKKAGKEFEAWSEWSACSKSCDGGVRSRVRACLGTGCVGHSKEFADCNKEPCAVAQVKSKQIYFSLISS